MITKKINAITEVIEKRWRASLKENRELAEISTQVLSDESDNTEREKIPYESGEFESDMQRLLELQFPFSCLPGIQIYSPRKRGELEFGTEIDHLLHFKLGGTDYLVVVEVKMQTLEVSEKGWRATYTAKETGKITKKCAKKQVDRQIQTLWEYIRPITSKVDLKFLGVVVSVDPATTEITASGYEGSPLVLLPVKKLIPYLYEFFNLDESEEKQAIRLMVSQSPFLALLRMSCPLAPLGHPELKSAISYVERCRRSLDESIYKDFEPTKGHWAINGSAGMGKSVLLAYTAAVLCSGYRLHEYKTGENYVGPAREIFGKIGFKDDKKLSIGILAMSTKQLNSLRFWFQFFVECFQEKDDVGQITFRKPEFLLVRTLDELQRKKWSALLVDECHDILPAAERVLVDAYKQHEFFLVVACDRHQKLRYSSNDSRILNGLDFGLQTKRLRQNYRNPTPINIASLALMFRWFADGGHKVVPTKEQLTEQFGFTVEGERATGYKLKIQTDAHPANAWAHTLASFPDANSAYRQLRAAHLPQQDVLWVRFCDEDQDFDYETLGRQFIYHVCRSVDAQKINDKYIKGQDYPVVVIEGFQGFMDRAETPDEEEKMWSFRRELYLCASRATCFLYLIANVPRTPEVIRIQQEIRNLVSALSVPANYGLGGTKIWEFVITPPELSRNLEFFQDNMPIADADTAIEVEQTTMVSEPVSNLAPIFAPPPPPAPNLDPEPEAWDLWVHGPITLNEFAAEVGRKPFQIMAELIKMNIFLQPNSLIEIPVLEKLTETFGGTLQIFESNPESDAVDDDLPPVQAMLPVSEETIQPDSVANSEVSHAAAGRNLSSRTTEEFSDLLKKKYAILDLLDSNAVYPRRRQGDDGADSTPPFMVGPRAYIRAGRWIDERNYGLGKVLVLNTRPGYADSHHVWFEKPNAIMRNYPLRGRVSRVIDESRIPPEIKNRCPEPSSE